MHFHSNHAAVYRVAGHSRVTGHARKVDPDIAILDPDIAIVGDVHNTKARRTTITPTPIPQETTQTQGMSKTTTNNVIDHNHVTDPVNNLK